MTTREEDPALASRHLVDPELLPLLDMLEALIPSPIDAANLAEQRARSLPLPEPGDDGVLIETRMVPGPAGAPDVGLRIYRPSGASGALPVIYHIHGGGYVLGSAETSEPICRPLVAELGCALVSVDYRLAPETPHPGPVEDCYAGLAWLFDNAVAEGFDPARIGVKGESAGGGLAAALALLARDRGRYQLAFQHLIYPMLDDRTGSGTDTHPHVGEFVWQLPSNRFGWASLLGQTPGGPNVSPYAAPARATNLAGLPPTFIYVGTLDLFLEEDIDYARRLLHAGVPVELHLLPGAFHAFELQADAAIARQAGQLSVAALRRFLAPPV
jgi:triacylglycerol lipase